ncbi:alanine racemase, partial [Patulibacter sp. S7RM1-6]
VPAARSALAAGATWLAVVTAGEATELRRAGVDARLLVLGPLPGDDLVEAVAADAEVVVWEEDGLDRLRALERPAAVHVKLDSGMGRLGQRDPDVALDLCRRVAETPQLRLTGAMTHFATADERGDAFFGEQLARFATFAGRVRERFPGVVLHAANSAATFRDPAAHFDMVRPGVALYGMDPYQEDPDGLGLEPVMAWTSALVSVKPLEAGESVGYGRHFVAAQATRIGNVPAGYADGMRRALRTGGAELLVAGRRVPLVGSVSMDSVGVDLGPGAGEAVGAPVTILGRDDAERITAEEIARRLGTINYEVTCMVGPRVPRLHHRDGAPVAAA